MIKGAKNLDKITSTNLGMDAESIRKSFDSHVEYTQAKDEYTVSARDFFEALARSARDRQIDRWNQTQQSYYSTETRRVYYLSLEFLMGRMLRNALHNLGIFEEAREALANYNLDIEQVLDQELDAGLGNGGLGRLAACFLDSMATLRLPAMGYGIRYEYGIFRQLVIDNRQIEAPDNWLRYGSPWDIRRPDCMFPIQFYGQTLMHKDKSGRLKVEWVDSLNIMAIAHDFLVPGYKNETVNTLRLWSANASQEFDFLNFNQGDYIRAVHEKNASENISRVLYPNDNMIQGKELRLKQEYFFVSATLQDAIRRHLKLHGTLENLHEKAVFQLNDTHPALAVAELMRLLMDDYDFEWAQAWEITTQCMAYTNHTILPEALEQWPVGLMEYLLPRHLQIIYEINERFLMSVRTRFPLDEGRVSRMSIIGEGETRVVRMAHLAVVGSFSVNGVSALHSDIVRDQLFGDFSEMFPGRFNNKTNGVTPRRWIEACNPSLTRLISSRIGGDWVRELTGIAAIEPLADDRGFQQSWRDSKRDNKLRLASWISKEMKIAINLDSIIDVQVKRIHEYKRQLLNVLRVLRLYLDLKNGAKIASPRTVIIGGKAAPGYDLAKRIIHLTNAAGQRINNDPQTSDMLKLIFVPNYSVSVAEVIIPATELSEQISTAGTEASGTGNMKFAMNGALTIGTRDGANIEIGDSVGEENIYFFGLTTPEVNAIHQRGYHSSEWLNNNPGLVEVLQWISSPDLDPQEPGAFWPIVDSLVHRDAYLVLADFDAYCAAQAQVDADYQKVTEWTRKSILNTSRTARFSSDKTINEYANEIWKTAPVSQKNL